MSSLELGVVPRATTRNLATGHDVRGFHVPTEIFAVIFVLTLPPSRFVVPSRTATPLAVSAVCQRWREAALSTPLLWKSLFLDGTLGRTNKSGYVDFCREWLSRAGSYPLSLSLNASSSPDTAMPLLDLLRGRSQQWQDIELILGDLPRILPFSRADYPLLEKISIVPPNGGLLISLHDAPKLREVSLSRYSANVYLPRQQLATFRTQAIEVLPFLGFLREATDLVEGTFSLQASWIASSLPNFVLSVARLQSLTLGSAHSDGGSGLPILILNCLQTPALKALSLSLPYHSMWSGDNVSPLQSFISRSSFQLHALALSFIQFSTQALIQCLRALPSLVHFKLKPLSIDLASLFAQLIGFPPLLPQLESFHLVFAFPNIPGVTSVTAAVVFQMLSWRWNITQLQAFRLTHFTKNSQIVEDIASHPEFRRLEEEGMALYVESDGVATVDTSFDVL
ncbi:hypothetical protein B0H12DRAFT_1136726 [Mycena haematopus]|nr:hypothetical protein B0H12DRAFT_1136726 [Mycena haematopus]